MQACNNHCLVEFLTLFTIHSSQFCHIDVFYYMTHFLHRGFNEQRDHFLELIPSSGTVNVYILQASYSEIGSARKVDVLEEFLLNLISRRLPCAYGLCWNADNEQKDCGDYKVSHRTTLPSRKWT